MHHSMESDRFNPGSISPDDIPGFMPSLSNLTPPSLPDLTANIVTSLSNLSVHPNLSNLTPSLHNLPYVERSLSRNSYSPSMSDSGISVDAASASNNHSLLNLQALIKLGTVALNSQGSHLSSIFIKDDYLFLSVLMHSQFCTVFKVQGSNFVGRLRTQWVRVWKG